jgi:hypothetical protein
MTGEGRQAFVGWITQLANANGPLGTFLDESYAAKTFDAEIELCEK